MVYGGNTITIYSCSNNLRGLDYSPNGKYLVNCSESAGVDLREYDTGNLIVRITDWPGDIMTEGSGADAGCSFDGNFVAASAASFNVDDTIAVWEILDLETGDHTRINEFTNHAQSGFPAPRLSWAPDKNYIVSGDRDGDIYVWKHDTGNIETSFTNHNNTITAVEWSFDGNYIISSDIDGIVYVWEWDTGNIETTFSEHTNQVLCVDLSPDGNYGVSSGQDSKVHVWERITGNIVATHNSDAYQVGAINWSAGGDHICFGDTDEMVFVWEWAADNIIVEYSTSYTPVQVLFFENDDYIATGSADGFGSRGRVRVFEWDKILADGSSEQTVLIDTDSEGNVIVNPAVISTLPATDIEYGIPGGE